MSRDGQQYGPYSIEDARAHLVAGSLLPTDYAFLEGTANWAPLEQVLATVAQPVVSPGPPQPQPGSVVQAAPVVQQSTSGAAALIAAREAKAKKVRKKKPKPKKKSKTTSVNFGALLSQYKVILAVVVIIATGLYIYNGLKDTPPVHEGDPNAPAVDDEWNEQMEQVLSGSPEERGGSGSDNPKDD